MSVYDPERLIKISTDSIPGLIAYWDRDLICHYANKPYKDWFGKTPEQLIGKSLHELLGPDLFAINAPYIRAVLAGENIQFERKMLLANGQTANFLAHYIPDIIDGNVIGFMAYVTDVTALKKTQDALRNTQDFLERTGRLAGVGGWELDLISGDLIWSDEVCRIHGMPLGYKPTVEEAIQFYSERSQPKIRAAVEMAIAHGTHFKLDLNIIRKDGEYRQIRTVGTIDYEHGKAVRLAGAFQDITDEKARADHLTLMEAALSKLSDIVIITKDEPIDGVCGPRIIFVNDAFVEGTGYTRAEAIGKTPQILFGPNTQPDQLAKIRIALMEQRPVRAELINYTKTRKEFYVERDIAPIFDEEGQLTHWVSVGRDITGRKKDEEALRLSEERFRLLTRATKDVVWDWDIVNQTLTWNENFETTFGHDRNLPRAGVHSWIDHIHPADRRGIVESRMTAIRNKETNWNAEYRFQHADLQTLTVADRGFVIYNEAGVAIRMIGSMVDITERRLIDERMRQSQKLEAIGQLTGGIAHDFNNLLTVILANAEQLSELLPAGSALKTMAEMTANAAEHGAELTHRLLAFARKQALVPKLVDMNQLIAGMNGLLTRALTAEIAIKTIASPGLWLTKVDPGQLESALLNLAINARDSMQDGGSLTIKAKNIVIQDKDRRAIPDLSDGQYVLISVSDTGSGMPAEVVERAFEPFFTTKEIGKGTGLGLSMVYGFVKQSGGHAKIDSTMGLGTTINLYFPRAEAIGSLRESQPARIETVGGHEHILVVEDNGLVREHLTGQLKGLGYRVTAIENGDIALKILEQPNDIDLLFTDIVMPGKINGRQLAETTRRRFPELKILFTSGYAQSTHVAACQVDSDIIMLSKPYRRQLMAEKVREALGKFGPEA